MRGSPSLSAATEPWSAKAAKSQAAHRLSPLRRSWRGGPVAPCAGCRHAEGATSTMSWTRAPDRVSRSSRSRGCSTPRLSWTWIYWTQDQLPREAAISMITLAELQAGPMATGMTRAQRARRQDRLQRTEAAFDPLPSTSKPPEHGRVHAAVLPGQGARSRRLRRPADRRPGVPRGAAAPGHCVMLRTLLFEGLTIVVRSGAR